MDATLSQRGVHGRSGVRLYAEVPLEPTEEDLRKEEQLRSEEEENQSPKALAEKMFNLGPSWKEGHDLLQLYIRDAGKSALLTKAEEVALGKKIKKGDKVARERFVRANLLLVISVVGRYARVTRSMTILDLIQEGNIGLFTAVDRWNHRLGFKFSTYATWWIRQRVLRSIADQDRTVRLPVHTFELVRKYKKIERERFLRSGVDPGFKEVVSAMGITPVEAVRLQKAFRFERVASLDVSPQGSGQGDDEGGPLSSLIPDTSSPTPEEQLTEMYLSEDIERVLAGLTRRDRDMLRMRMGVNGEKATLEKVGARFGVTRERVRQIMKAILRKVHTRAHLGDETFDEFRKKNK